MPLSAGRLESYRRKLLEIQANLSREYRKEREESLEQRKEVPEDRVDLAVRSYARDFLLSLSEEDRKRLFMVEDALGRIARGEYGLCSHCGSRIPESRLDAVPWARLCIVCQGLQEEGLLPRWTFFAEGGRATPPGASASAAAPPLRTAKPVRPKKPAKTARPSKPRR